MRSESERGAKRVSGPGLPGERGYTFEFKVAFWLVAGFTLVSFRPCPMGTGPFPFWSVPGLPC